MFKNFKLSNIPKEFSIPFFILLALGVGFLGRGLLKTSIEVLPSPTSTVKPVNVILPSPVAGKYKVTRVLDGDTIQIETGEKVRYMGINAPENNEAWGLTATEFNKKIVEGKEVEIELDRTKLDTYGRVLAYVWIDEKMVNEVLLKEGLAKVMIIKGEAKLKYIDRLKVAEEYGREHSNGMWLDEWEK
jgi:micrococcal nuclease